MNQKDKERYSRQILVIGEKNQEQLMNSTVTIIGMGALGTVVAQLLARAGVNLNLIDSDIVETSNLQRQLLYDETDVLKSKVECAKKHLQKINSTITINVKITDLNANNLNQLKGLIIDCTDNLETRFLINEYCVKHNLPWIYTGAVENRASIYVFNPKTDRKVPCFNCFTTNSKNQGNCQTLGILAPASVLIASITASEAIKLLTNQKTEEQIIHINLKDNTFEKIKVKQNKNCSVCKGQFTLLNKEGKSNIKNKKIEYEIKLCKSRQTLTATPKKKVSINIKKCNELFDVLTDGGILAVYTINNKQVIVHSFGNILFKDKEDVTFIKKTCDTIYEQCLN